MSLKNYRLSVQYTEQNIACKKIIEYINKSLLQCKLKTYFS